MTPIKQGIYEFKKDSLIEIRRDLGLSQGKMAKLLGIPPNTLSRWETGATIPDAGTLASIYSLARELGVDTPSFFGMREDIPPLKIGSSYSREDSTQSLSFYHGLKSYLKTQIENIGSDTNPVIKVEICNTAPDDPSLPKIVFKGVGLSLASIGRDIKSFMPQLKVKTSRISKIEEIEAKITPWENDAKRKGLLSPSYHRLDSTELPDFQPNKHEQEVILFQGESIVYEIEIPGNLLPYIKFRTEGGISEHYLFSCEETFEMPEALTKPLAISALKDFNSIDIHKLIIPVINSIKDYTNNFKSFELANFKILLSETIKEAEHMEDTFHNLSRQHSLNWFRAHVRSTHIYIDIVKRSLKRLKEAVEAVDGSTDKTAAVASAILSLKNLAHQLNHETEELMDMFNISDEEAGYRYRNMN